MTRLWRSNLEPIFNFYERSESVTAFFRITNNQKEQCLENTAGAVKHSHLSVSKYFFTTLATWGRALSWRRITLSYCHFVYLYSDRFSRNARLKQINCSRYRSLVWNRQVSSAHNKQDSFGVTRYRAWSSNHECSAVVLMLRSMATIDRA